MSFSAFAHAFIPSTSTTLHTKLSPIQPRCPRSRKSQTNRPFRASLENNEPPSNDSSRPQFYSPSLEKLKPPPPDSDAQTSKEDPIPRSWWQRVLHDDQFDDLRTFSVAFVVALLVRAVIVEPRYIPSLSMFPTFDIGDQFLVDKVSKYVREAESGDIVVFEPPEILRERGYRKKDAFIKRVVAKGGDNVIIRDGTLWVNGQKREEPFVKENPNYEWGPDTVPQGFVMVLGDNRNNSFDSHIWGFLPEQNIIGRALVRYWPPSRFGASFL